MFMKHGLPMKMQFVKLLACWIIPISSHQKLERPTKTPPQGNTTVPISDFYWSFSSNKRTCRCFYGISTSIWINYSCYHECSAVWLSQSRSGMANPHKSIFIAGHSRVERSDFSNDDEKDAEFFAASNGEDDMISEVLFDASSP